MFNSDYLNDLEGTFPIRYIPDDFFMCDHGYDHYGACPLCGRFPSAVVQEIDDYFCDEVSVEDKAEVAEWIVYGRSYSLANPRKGG